MSSFSIHKENINKLIEISLKAGEAIMSIYSDNFEIERKHDQSPVTKADIISDRIILNSLKKLTPNIPTLSEESSKIPFSERVKWKEYWLIDPLDGTKEFIKKNGEFTTNIALIRDNKPIFGIIHAPAITETYWGAKEIGAYFLNGDTECNSKKITTNHSSDSKIKVISSRSHPSSELKYLLGRLSDYDLIGTGSSLKFCKIASGEADCYPRLGPTCEWDTAAGEIIASSAGGIVTDIMGKDMKYNSTKDCLNPSFLVSNNLDTQKKILSLI